MKNNYSPDILNCLANLSSDEVFTSPELANRMLDLLPQELFRSPKTRFLDPCCKSGVFLREIAKRLLSGLEKQIPNLQDRIDHIMTQQVFGIACTDLTAEMSRRTLYCSKHANGKYSVTEAFHNDVGNVWYQRCKHTWNAQGRCEHCGASKGEYARSDSRETYAYLQTAFRVQSPWTATDKDDPTKKNILKTTCYVFDFAPNRALREVVTYANQLDIDSNRRITDKVDAFINFLPILQFDGSSMKRVDATEILDFVDNGTSGTLLARRWNSAQLVNVDNATLQRVLDNPEALATIMKIEGFRALGSDIIESIVNKADKIKRLKREMGDKKNSSKKKELSAVEKEYRSKRREVQEKLMKFATRIPIFMYLTDYREESLEDVIRKLEPSLFGRVTGLAIDDFDLLLRVGVFNRAQMNDAILKFRRYEDASLAYTGVNRHTSDTRIGLMDSTVPIEARLVAGKAPISRM